MVTKLSKTDYLLPVHCEAGYELTLEPNGLVYLSAAWSPLVAAKLGPKPLLGSPGSHCRLLPARLGEHDNGPTAALERGLHSTHGGGFCGVAGNRRQTAEFLE